MAVLNVSLYWKVSVLGAEQDLGPIVAAIITGREIDPSDAYAARFVSTSLDLPSGFEPASIEARVWWQHTTYETGASSYQLSMHSSYV